MARLLTVSIAALAVVAAGAANAADLPARPAPPARAPVFVAPVYNWTGFYVGINGGGAWAHKCWERVLAAAVAFNEGCHDATGGMVGGQVGFNWQMGGFVFGVEGSGDWASLSGTNNSLFAAGSNRSQIDAIWTATGRLGYAWDALLLYGKGGGAWVNDKYRITTLGAAGAIPAGAVVGAASETRLGWTVGAGLEWGFAQNWSVAIEYDHFDFNNRSVTFAPGVAAVGPFADRIRQTVDAVTARINWRFGGGPVVARY